MHLTGEREFDAWSISQRPHYAGQFSKGSFLKTLFKPEEQTGFVRTKNIFKMELFENDDVKIMM